MAGFGAHVWFSDFIPALCELIADNVKGFTRDRVFRSNYDDQLHADFPPDDRFVTVFVPEGKADQRAVDGGGAITTPFDSTVVTTLFVRLEADIEGRSTKEMEDEAAGVDETLRQLIAAVQMWNSPVGDVERLQDLRRPARVLNFRTNRKSARGNTRWCVVNVSWELSFVADLGVYYPVVPTVAGAAVVDAVNLAVTFDRELDETYSGGTAAGFVVTSTGGPVVPDVMTVVGSVVTIHLGQGSFHHGDVVKLGNDGTAAVYGLPDGTRATAFSNLSVSNPL